MIYSKPPFSGPETVLKYLARYTHRVAISNQRLADYTRKTTRTVTRCLKKLVEAGILAYRDSPTGRRLGQSVGARRVTIRVHTETPERPA